ncbi:MAG: SprT family zinc-dependent metalloprotease [Vicingaceae bacterium]
MKQAIQFGLSTIDFELRFDDRKTLGIKVHPDKSVRVIAPHETSTEKIKEKVKSKAAWILKQQDFFIGFHPKTPARKYISGESHLYLGKRYRLRIRESKSESVKLLNGYLYILTKDKADKIRIKNQLCLWYEEKAATHFERIIEQYQPLAEKLSEKQVKVYYRWLEKRWGSCSKTARINLNYELIKAPKKCIEYVVVHELCHLAHLNHSRAFYELLEENFPNWKKTKSYLEKLMV